MPCFNSTQKFIKLRVYLRMKVILELKELSILDYLTPPLTDLEIK